MSEINFGILVVIFMVQSRKETDYFDNKFNN
jgi:hypothetical protein